MNINIFSLFGQFNMIKITSKTINQRITKQNTIRKHIKKQQHKIKINE